MRSDRSGPEDIDDNACPKLPTIANSKTMITMATDPPSLRPIPRGES
jgi:hypothetical protein